MSNQDEIYMVSLDDAIRRKFEDGRKGRGSFWSGEHPLIKAYEAALNLVVYLDVESNRTGNTRDYRHRIDALAEAAYTQAGDLRTLLRTRHTLTFKTFQPLLSSDPSRYALRT